MIVGRLASPNTLVVLWTVVLTLLILVEVLEILRALQRIRRYGWKKGIFSYSVSQWSRNFTFGMFYAFTLNLPFNRSALAGNTFLHAMKNIVIAYWKDVIIALFLVEVFLFVCNLMVKHRGTSAHHNLTSNT